MKDLPGGNRLIFFSSTRSNARDTAHIQYIRLNKQLGLFSPITSDLISELSA